MKKFFVLAIVAMFAVLAASATEIEMDLDVKCYASQDMTGYAKIDSTRIIMDEESLIIFNMDGSKERYNIVEFWNDGENVFAKLDTEDKIECPYTAFEWNPQFGNIILFDCENCRSRNFVYEWDILAEYRKF